MDGRHIQRSLKFGCEFFLHADDVLTRLIDQRGRFLNSTICKRDVKHKPLSLYNVHLFVDVRDLGGKCLRQCVHEQQILLCKE